MNHTIVSNIKNYPSLHDRMVHPSVDILRKLIENGMVKGTTSIENWPPPDLCHGCEAGEMGQKLLKQKHEEKKMYDLFELWKNV